ncbi:hypothetical protein D3C87_2077930 [compost metagenome]
MPALFDKASEKIAEKGKYACTHCGNVSVIEPKNTHQCAKCGHKKWVKALKTCRVK